MPDSDSVAKIAPKVFSRPRGNSLGDLGGQNGARARFELSSPALPPGSAPGVVFGGCRCNLNFKGLEAVIDEL